MRISVNGSERLVSGKMEEGSLLNYLREELNLKGTKNGCGIGACGACTVLVDGRPKKACVTPVKKVAGAAVVTIEGVGGPDGALHPVQQAFIEAGAIQCGFCTPGMVLRTIALLNENPNPDREAIRAALKGNLCRCTGYQQIIDAVELAAERLAIV